MSEEIFQALARHIATIEQDAPSERIHSFPIGGRMAYYCVVNDSVELVQAAKAASDIALPYVVVGQSRGVFIHDDGFAGLVIHNQSKGMAFSAEQSQVVVESGALLQSVIMQAANRGMGGLIHLYGMGGSIGGALYRNRAVHGQPLSDSLRSLTVLMPPTRIKPEPSIMRFRNTWLTTKVEEGKTKLESFYDQHPHDPQPVVLTAQLQLTSLRHDELARRLQVEAQAYAKALPSDKHIGPLFKDLPEGSPDAYLQKAEAYKMRHPGFIVKKEQPNYCVVKSRYVRECGGRIPVVEVQAFVEKIQAQVKERTAVELQPAFRVH